MLSFLWSLIRFLTLSPWTGPIASPPRMDNSKNHKNQLVLPCCCGFQSFQICMPGLFHFGRIPFLQSTNWWVRVLHSRGKLPQSRHVSTTDIHERSEMVSKSIVELEQHHAWKGRPMDGFTVRSTYTQTSGIHFKVWHFIFLMGHYGTYTKFRFASKACFQQHVDVLLMWYCWYCYNFTNLPQVAGVEIVPTSALDKEKKDTSLKQFVVLRCPSMSCVYYLQNERTP